MLLALQPHIGLLVRELAYKLAFLESSTCHSENRLFSEKCWAISAMITN